MQDFLKVWPEIIFNRLAAAAAAAGPVEQGRQQLGLTQDTQFISAAAAAVEDTPA